MTMIKNKWQLLVFVTTAVLFVSCHSKGPQEARFIPKDASFVMAVDPGSLQDKMKNGNIDIDSLFKQVMGQDSSAAKNKKYFDDFKNAGIDWSKKLFVFATQKTDASKGQSHFINILGSLKDSAKLLAYLETIDEIKGRDVKEGKGYSYIPLDYRGMISWTDKNIIATFYSYTEGTMRYMDTSLSPGINKSAEIEKEVARYYSLKEKESIISVTPFTDIFKEKADGYFLNSTNNIQNILSRMPMQLPKLDELLKDNYTAGTFNFDKGKIVAASAFYPNDILGTLLKKYGGHTINTSLIDNYPSGNIDMMAITSFNPAILGGILQQLEVESLVDGFLEKMGLTSKDLYQCLKGDIAFAVSDLSLNKKTSVTFPFSKPSYKMILDAAIGDTASFHKLMEKAAENHLVIKENNGYRSGALMRSVGLFLHTDNKNLVLASDSLTYIQYASKTSSAGISGDIIRQIKGKSTAVYIDIDRMLGSFSAGTQDKDTSSPLRTAKAVFKDIIATSANFDGTKITSKMEMRLQDNRQNSLVTLMKLIPSVADQIKKSKISAEGDTESLLSLPFLSKINNL
jgi:hypothetical protein